MKTCFFCKGEVKRVVIDHMFASSEGYVLVKDLEVEKCLQCGEVYFDSDASKAVDGALALADKTEEVLSVPVVHATV